MSTLIDSPSQGSRPKAANRRHALNWRLLLITLALVAVVAPVSYLWYRHRLTKTAGAMLERAEQLEQEKDYSQAASYYQRCLLLEPDDTQTFVRMVEAYGKQPPTPSRINRLSGLLYQALGRAPDRDDLRHLLAENLLKSGNYAQAEEEAKKITGKAPAEALAAKKVIALSLNARARADGTIPFEKAVQSLLDAAQEMPGDAELVTVAAVALREHPSAASLQGVDPATYADQLMDRLVAGDPKNVDALVARYQYRLRYQLPQSERDLASALKIAPDNMNVLLLSADEAVSQESQPERAESLLRHAIDLEPSDPRVYLALARVVDQPDHHEAAIDLLQRGRSNAKNNPDLGLALVGTQIAAGDMKAAQESLRDVEAGSAEYLARLATEQRKQFDNRLKLLHARLELAQGEPMSAAEKLRAILLTTGEDTKEHSVEWMQATELLARISAGMGQWDQASEYWGNLVKAQPAEIKIVQPAVAAYLAAGNPAQAIECLDAYAHRKKPSNDLLIQLVQAQLALQLGRPAADRNWTEFERAMQAAKAQVSDRSELVFAAFDYLLAKDGESSAAASGDSAALPSSDNRKRAALLLHNTEHQFADQGPYWRSTALAYQRLGQAEDVQRALARYTALEPSAAERAKLEASLLTNERKFRDADQILAAALPTLPKPERSQLEQQRIVTLAAAGELPAAQELVGQLIAATPAAPELLAIGIQVALEAGDLATAEKWEDSLGKIAPDSFDWRFLRARRLLAAFDRLAPQEKQELTRLVTELRGERPRWYPIVALAAKHSDLEGDSRTALSDYRQAVDLGDRRSTSLRQLVSLLYQFERFGEARAYLSRLSAEQPANQLLTTLAIDDAVKQDRLKDAIDLARRSLKRSPDDAMQPIWLANLLMRDHQPQEAVNVLREAADRFSDDARVWNELFSLYLQNGQIEEAKRTLEALVNDSKLPEGIRHFVAAQGFDALGNVAEAKKQYELAVAGQPDEAAFRLRFAKFLLANDTAEARNQYERVLRREPDNAEARRALANLLAISGKDADWLRAKKLLEQQGDDSAASAATNDRLRATLLARQGRTRAERIANCQAARQILQQLMKTQGTAEGDMNRLVLARVLEQEADLNGDRALIVEARDQLRQIAEGKNSSQDNLLVYLEFLLRHATADTPETMAESTVAGGALDQAKMKEEFLSDAEKQIENLKRVAAGGGESSGTLASLALTVRLLEARGHTDEAAQQLADYIARQSGAKQDPKSRAELCLMAGGLYKMLGKQADSEKWYRQLMEISPNAYTLVVQSLVEQGKPAEAAEVCLNHSKGVPTPETAIQLANIISGMGNSVQELPQAQSAIEAAIANNPNNIDLLQAAGVMQAARGANDKAVATMRRLLEIAPLNTLALNNLATLLAERPNQRAEALQLIERAIESAGRQPSLLDTQGTIQLQTGDASQAIASLEEATAGGAKDPRYYFHLSAAYHQAGQEKEALGALKAARGLGLEKSVLTDEDRKLLNKLDEQLGHAPLTAEDK